jgi:hypothetical protein
VGNDTSRSHDLEKGKAISTTRSLPTPGSIIEDDCPRFALRIIDVMFDSHVEPSLQAGCDDEIHVEHTLSLPPPQAPGTARIFVSTFCIDPHNPPTSSLLLHLETLGVQTVAIPRTFDVSNLSCLARQWQDNAKPSCFGVRIHPTDSDLDAYMQCIPFDDDKLIGVFWSFLIYRSES